MKKMILALAARKLLSNASSEFRVRSSEFGVWSSEFGVRPKGLAPLRVRSLEFGVRSLEFEVWSFIFFI